MEKSQLNLREKICQMMVVKADPEKHIREFGSIENFLAKYPVGAIFVGTEIIRNDVFTAEKIAETVKIYQSASKIPLLVAGDAECGVGNVVRGLTTLPQPMALGSADDEELAYRYGKDTALESRSVGINWNYGPVCDLMINPLAALVSTRSVSDDPELASRILRSLMKGMQEHGMVATGKHFPGDGVDYRDQHYVGSYNTLPMAEWWKKSGATFQAVIDEGIDSIMLGHIALPDYQTETVEGVYPPATLSKELIDLLKKTMGFSGIVVTDALDMGGFVRWFDDRKVSEVKSIAAGADMLLWPFLETIDRVEEAVQVGEIPLSRIEDAVDRIFRVKEKYARFGWETGIKEEYLTFGKQVAVELAEKSCVQVRNRLQLLPLRKEAVKKVRIVEVDGGDATKEAKHPLTAVLAEEFAKRGAEVRTTGSWDNYLLNYDTEIDRDYDILVYVTYAGNGMPFDHTRKMVNAHSSQAFDREKTINITVGTPHYLSAYYPTADTALHCYLHPECIKAIVAAMYGEKPFLGRLPVRL